MGNIFTSLGVAVSGMTSSQAAIQTTGHNIANANTPGFSRQRVELTAALPQATAEGAIGRGVTIETVTRLREEMLDISLRRQLSLQDATIAVRDFLNRVEDQFNEPSDNGLSQLLNEFFANLQEVASNPDNLAVRENLLATTGVLADSFNSVANALNDLRTEANQQIRDTVEEINGLTSQIASLNTQIATFEVGGHSANDLRDQRDDLIDQLSHLTNITSIELSNGGVSLTVSGQALVDGSTAFKLAAQTDPSIDPDRPDFVKVVFASSGETLTPNSGRLKGLMNARDTEIKQTLDDLNSLARSLIEQVNLIHSNGNGLTGYESVTGTNAVASTTADLDDPTAGLAFTPVNGSFQIHVLDETLGTTTTTVINVDLDGTGGDDSLADIRDKINAAVVNVTASINADAQLVLTAAANFSFTFSDDTSKLLQVLGINTFFSGEDAFDISINPSLAENPGLFAAATSNDPAGVGDNTNALALANLQNSAVLNGNTTTIPGFYQTLIGNLGIRAREAQRLVDVRRNVADQLDNRRQQVSGVSLDEEVTNLILFQRMFQASAKVVGIVDEMLDTMINRM